MLLLLLAVSSTISFPIAIGALDLELDAGWLLGALLVLLFIVAIGIWGRFFLPGLSIAHPGKMYKDDLHLSRWEFKKNVIYRAGNNLDRNIALAQKKMYMARAMALLLSLEALFLLLSLRGLASHA